MRVVITSQGQDLEARVDPRFGRCAFLLLADSDNGTIIEAIDNSAIAGEAHGAGPKIASLVSSKGAQVIITGNGPGDNAHRVISAAGITVFTGAADKTVSEALEAYRSGSLTQFG